MKTCFNVYALVACVLLGLASIAAAQPNQKLVEPFEIKGQVIVHGQVIKIGDEFGVQAGTLQFVLGSYSRTDGRRLSENLNKGVTVKGCLRTRYTDRGFVLVIDRGEPFEQFQFGGDSLLHAKVEGHVQIRGLLTKDLPHFGDFRIPHDMKPAAYLFQRISRDFVPVCFAGAAAKKAVGLYGCNVILHARLEVVAPGSRSECMIFTLRDLERDGK